MSYRAPSLSFSPQNWNRVGRSVGRPVVKSFQEMILVYLVTVIRCNIVPQFLINFLVMYIKGFYFYFDGILTLKQLNFHRMVANQSNSYHFQATGIFEF